MNNTLKYDHFMKIRSGGQFCRPMPISFNRIHINNKKKTTTNFDHQPLLPQNRN